MTTRCFKYFTIFTFFIVYAFGCQTEKIDSQEPNINKNDSISFYIAKASDEKSDKDLSKQYFEKAYKLNDLLEVDSIKNNNLREIAYESYKKMHFSTFKKANKKALKMSIKLGDTFSIGDTHWNYGNYFNKIEVIDSAYYHYSKAEEFFSSIDNDYYSARMLYNMAVIQAKIKDYTGSEVLTFNAITRFKSLANTSKNLYRCYNHLGVIYKDLEEYERSIFYYNKALDYLDEVDNKRDFKEVTLSNIGLAYHESENYDSSIEYYKKALSSENLKSKSTILYARVLDNLTHSRLLKGERSNIEKDFNTALRIRDSLSNMNGAVISKLHLAEYYAKLRDTVNAVKFATESKNLAKKTFNNRDYLAALHLLSEIDEENSKTYLTEYVSLSDSLQKEERKIRDKFTRIRFETDEYVEETERLSQQKIWISSLAIVLSILFSLIYFLKQQRSKNKELMYEAKQQTYNEEIYKLMFKQQASLQKGRLEERNRISEELHDGVLSKLFGTRMGIGFLNIEGDKETLEQHKDYINELQEVEKEIRVISHELKKESVDAEINFLSLIKNLVEKQSQISHFNYSVSDKNHINWDDVDEKIKIHLYRIIQEALSNISKYAKAKNVEINFNTTDNLFILTVKDDGIGFRESKKIKGIGLLNMQSRTHKLNGKFHVDSQIGHGTIITVSINI